MRGTVAHSLQQFPEHAAIIGDMLLGYADLEFLTVDLVGQALGNVETAARLLYRLRGANDRLNVADAIIRPYMATLKLTGPYTQWLGAMRRCRVIRNQYAHCGWVADMGELHFSCLDTVAQSTDGAAIIRYERIGLDLLKEQQAYFRYAGDVTLFLSNEAQFRANPERRHRNRLPKSRAAPKLYNPED